MTHQHQGQGRTCKVKGHRAKKHANAHLLFMDNVHMHIPWVQELEHDFQGQGPNFKVKDHRVIKTSILGK